MGTQEDRRVEHVIPRAAVESGRYDLVIELSVNAMFGLGSKQSRYQEPLKDKYFDLVTADIFVSRSEARHLQYDFVILSQIARSGHSSVQKRALKATQEIMNAWRRDEGDVESGDLAQLVARCRKIGWRVLGDLDPQSIARTQTNLAGEDVNIWAIGHCHIDTAWLWRYTQTQQKVARSWSTQLDLLERYPSYHFVASSAQQYLWLEELYPDLFKRVQKAVADGRFHITGGAWLEHDCILPSGESLCRQYLYGQRYFERKFGKRCTEAWCPDSECDPSPS